jgi:hypothetical protein
VSQLHLSPLVFAALLATACGAPSATSPADGAPAHSAAGEAAPVATSASAAVAPLASSSAPVAAAEPAPSASASAAPSTAPAAPVAPVAPEVPLPNVKVANIGMHIGGGPNDAPTKEPIHRSVIPHYDEFRRCYALVEDPKKGGTFGVDLLIDKAGGKPKSVTKPRSPMKGHGFSECMVKAFEQIDFQKPKGGNTKVSYSLRFTP